MEREGTAFDSDKSSHSLCVSHIRIQSILHQSAHPVCQCNIWAWVVDRLPSAVVYLMSETA